MLGVRVVLIPKPSPGCTKVPLFPFKLINGVCVAAFLAKVCVISPKSKLLSLKRIPSALVVIEMIGIVFCFPMMPGLVLMKVRLTLMSLFWKTTDPRNLSWLARIFESATLKLLVDSAIVIADKSLFGSP